jgi:PAS domain S-box-containing protein
MSESLRALIVEDQSADAELVVVELERAGFDPQWKRVETEEQYLRQLETSPEIILADYALPRFGAIRALEVLQKKGLDIPFIIVSGSIGEEIAVEAMRNGAADYLLKDRLGRLGPAVNNALEQSRSRKKIALAAVELRSTHEQLSHLLAHNPAVIYSVRIENHRVIQRVVSDNIERLLGVRLDEATHEWWLDSLHPDDRERVLNRLGKLLSGDGYSMEYRLRHKDGSYHWIEDNYRVVRDKGGHATEAVGLWTDITERKQAEDRVREQARLLDLAQDAIMVRDMEDRVEFWNHGAEKLYGWTAAEVHCKKASSFFCEGDHAGAVAKRAAVIENGKWTGECKHTCKDHGTVTVRSRWTLVRDALGAPKSILIINTDITEQKKVEEQFLRAQRLESIGTLASGVAHDLNNILVPILMATPLLSGDVPEEEREKLLAIVQSSAERGASIVKQVLTFARGADGDRVLLQPIYIAQEIAKIAEQTFPKSVAIRTNYPEDLWTIVADPTQLHQILLNLCINARDAMPSGGALTLALKNFEVDDHYASMTPGAKAGPHVLFEIKDTGTGIPPETIDRIFDPFFTTKQPGHGTGLGLSTVMGIVKSHGGFTQVYSELGRGTCFKVFLPANISELATAQTFGTLPLPRANDELLLIVDDENFILQVAKAILEDHGYRVLTAADATEALAIFALRMNEIALVLTDLAMPFMDGVALIRTLQKMKPDVRVIASSGRGDPEGRVNEIAHLNICASLTKPYNKNKLLMTLHDVLAKGPDRQMNSVATLIDLPTLASTAGFHRSPSSAQILTNNH